MTEATIPEIARALEISLSGAHYRAARDGWTYRKGPFGRHCYLVEALPGEVREALEAGRRPPRECDRCGEAILDRHRRAELCWSCLREVRNERNRVAEAAKAAIKRAGWKNSCRVCGADISHQRTDALRCRKCIKAGRRLPKAAREQVAREREEARPRTLGRRNPGLPPPAVEPPSRFALLKKRTFLDLGGAA